MELTPVRSFFGYSVYKTKNGATVKMKNDIYLHKTF